MYEPCVYFSNELNSRLSQCEFTERRLQADLDYHRKELEMSKGLCVELREKLEEMGDRLGQYLEQESEIKVQSYIEDLT